MSSPAEVPFTVIWGKETYDIKLVFASGVVALKKKLEELTGVPSDRMKLMPKSKGKHSPRVFLESRFEPIRIWVQFRYTSTRVCMLDWIAARLSLLTTSGLPRLVLR